MPLRIKAALYVAIKRVHAFSQLLPGKLRHTFWEGFYDGVRAELRALRAERP